MTTVVGIGDGTEVGERADLPTEAYQALVALDLLAFRQGPLHYDRQLGRWRSELDEWQQRQAKDSGLA